MSVLTHEVAKALRDRVNANDPLELIRATEQAVLSKLAAGVSVEPVAEVQTLYYGSEHPPVAFTGVVLSDKTDYYSLPFRENTQLYTAAAIAAARVQESKYWRKFIFDNFGLETE